MANTLLKDLIEKWLINSITKAEKRRLMEFLHDPANDDAVTSLMDEQWAAGMFDAEADDHVRRLIFERIHSQMEHRTPVRPLRNWKNWAVAASLAIMTGIAAYFIIGNKQVEQEPQVAQQNDVAAPDATKAYLTLADGRVVYIDSIGNGQLAVQQEVPLTKTVDGKVVYQLTDDRGQLREMKYNTLTNPRGSKVIDVTLSDGSRVWLNAGSSVKYPVVFIGNDRNVEITGEAYFEVSHDKTKPFFVNKGDVQVQVLGTHFNVNAYDDEREIKVTLLEGRVAVRRESSVVKIKPGEQAVTVDSGQLAVHKDVDTERVMAWKNDKFVFAGDNIQSVMRQLSRWYDVQVVYDGAIPRDEFVGVISRSRNEKISAILNFVEKTKIVKFKVEGKKVIVQSNVSK